MRFTQNLPRNLSLNKPLADSKTLNSMHCILDLFDMYKLMHPKSDYTDCCPRQSRLIICHESSCGEWMHLCTDSSAASPFIMPPTQRQNSLTFPKRNNEEPCGSAHAGKQNPSIHHRRRRKIIVGPNCVSNINESRVHGSPDRSERGVIFIVPLSNNPFSGWLLLCSLSRGDCCMEP